MIRIASISIAAVLAAGAVDAQNVTIRSGEHASFTRLALNISSETDWSIERSDRNATLTLANQKPRFVLDQVFSRIPRDRILDVKQTETGGPLDISLGCDCSVVAFIEGGLLVIDIKDEVETADRIDPQEISFPSNSYKYSFLVPRSPSGPATQVETNTTAEPVGAKDTQPLLLPSVEVFSQQNSRRLAGLNLLEERLLEQLGRATNQGLISPVKPLVPKAPHQEITAEVPSEIKTPALKPVPPGITVKTAADRDLAVVVDALRQTDEPGVCIDPEEVNIAAWSDETPFSAQISSYRSELFKEFDRIDPFIALKLARTYLHFGFGAEAAEVARLAEPNSASTSIVVALADLLDKGELNDKNPFAGQQSCDSAVALWAAYAGPIETDSVNLDAVIQTFAGLPGHLRSLIGPMLSERFTDVGDPRTAEAILRATERATSEPDSGLELAKARSAALRGDAAAANEMLSDVAETKSEQAPRALIALVNNLFETRSSAPPDLPALAASFAQEYRRSELGPALHVAHAISLVLSDKFVDGFAELERIRDTVEPNSHLNASIVSLHLLAERANDVTFLRLVLHHVSGIEADLPFELGDKLARRLLDLGFAEPAVRLLAGSTEGSVSEDRRLLRAEAAIDQELPYQALVALLGIEGQEVARLRAQAMLQIQDYEAAGRMLDMSNDLEGAARSFWLAGSWQPAEGEEQTVYGKIAGRTAQLAQNETSTLGMPPLARARAMIEESNSTRSEIEGLLEMLSIAAE